MYSVLQKTRLTQLSTVMGTDKGGIDMSGWKDTGRRILQSRDYVAPENRLHELKLSDGTSVGKVSYGAYNAVKYNNLDKYTPKNDDEKKVLDNLGK